MIDKATEIEVTLNNKKEYKGKIIGVDATNDIALIKVEAKDLPYITFGDSDYVKVGEWVKLKDNDKFIQIIEIENDPILLNQLNLVLRNP